MMSGHEILQHFARELARIEASLPCLFHVSSVSAMHDLDAYRRSYEGTPVTFPSSWIPNWHQSLSAVSSSSPSSSSSSFSCLLEGLQSLLRDCVEVEVFHLHYQVGANNKGEIGTDDKEEEVVNVSHLDSSLKQQLDLSANDLPGFQGIMKEVGSFRNNQKDFSLENSTSLEKSLPLRNVHPIPSSSTELMDFAAFVSEASDLLLCPANELMYLTWRSLPSLYDLKCSSAPSEFRFFIEKLVHPTTTPDFLSNETIKQRNLWMGVLVTSRLHFDALDNVHICLSGRKVFHLYSPQDLPNMYPEPRKEGALNNFSSIESVFLANLREHPRFFHAKCFRAEIKEGEAIFIPAGWWHEVFTLQYSLSINVWFGPSPNSLFRPTLLHLNSGRYLNFRLEREKHDTV